MYMLHLYLEQRYWRPQVS